MSNIQRRENGKWRARYRDQAGREHARHFDRKVDAQRWLDEVTAAVVTGTYVDPQLRRTTVAEWAEQWLIGYQSRRASTVRQAKVHLRRIVARFGPYTLDAVRPSDVRAWMADLAAEGLADSTRYALHSRLAHLFADAVHDGIIPRSPVSRRTSPGVGKARPYVATTEQVWALHDAMPEGMRSAILLGAFAGLRLGEIVALRVSDVDFMRGIVSPAIQYPGVPLKTDTSRTPIPIPRDLAAHLAIVPQRYQAPTLVVGVFGRPIAPYTLETAFRKARETVDGLPEGFRLHDLRHYFASLLIASGLDVKTVQARLRHASAKTTLDVYGHVWPDRDDATRTAVQAALARPGAATAPTAMRAAKPA